jgi:hypothetical protein
LTGENFFSLPLTLVNGLNEQTIFGFSLISPREFLAKAPALLAVSPLAEANRNECCSV